MKGTTKAGRALAVVLSLVLVVSLNAPMAAWGDVDGLPADAGNGTAYMPQGTEDTQPGDALGTPDAQGSDTGSPSSGSDAPDPDGQQPGVRNQAIQTPDANGNETSGSTEGQAIDATNGPVGTSRSTTAGAIEVWRGYLSNTSDADKVGSYASLGEAVQAAAALESTAKLVYVRSDYTLEEDVVLPTGVTLYVYGEGYSEGDLGAVLTVPAGKTLSVEATSKNLNVMKNSTLAVEEGGTVLLEGGSYKASAQLGCVSVQLGAALTGTLSVPAGKVLFNAANKYYYAGDQSAIVAQVSNDGVPGRAFVLSSLANFVSQNGDTLTLLADQSEVSLGVGASDVTIDLGGKVLSGRTGKTSAVITASGTNLNVKRGTIKAADKNEAAIAISAGANAIVASDATIEGGQTLGVFLKSPRASLVVEGSISSTSNYAISGNGNGDSDDTSITVKEGASIKSEGATAIYHPQIGELNVEGGSISGTTGVEMRSGSLTMTGGEVKGTGAFAESANDGGPTTTGVGIAVVQHVTLHDLSVSIEGGTVAGTKNAVRQKTLVTDTSAVDKVKLSISGGTFTCDDAASDAASVYSENCTGFVAGGTYVGDPLAYLAQGCTSHANADGTYTVSQPTASVAASDGTAVSYGTFAEAWAAATDGSTLTLLADAALSDEAVLDGKRSVTFDLNGFNAVFGKAGTISITEGELNVINSVPGKGGTISAVEEGSKAPFGVTGNTDAATWSKVSTKSKLTIGAGVTVEAWASAVAIQGKGATLDVRGTLRGTSLNAAIQGNGTVDATTNNGGTTATVYEGAVVESGTGIFWPQSGTLTIKGGTVKGAYTGIEMRAGTLTMSDGEVVGNGPELVVNASDNGSTTDGAGIAVAQHTTKLPVKVTVTGGKVSGYAALYESNPQKNDADSIKQVKLYLNGGTFTAINSGTEAVYSEDCTKFVNNGTFSSDVSRYCMDYRVVSKNEDGTYTIVADQYATVENPGEAPFTASSLSNAFSKVKEGGTITLLKDVPATSATYSNNKKSCTLDLNGHTVDSTKFATLNVTKYVSSTTEDYAQVVVKNGTIRNSYNGSADPLGVAVYADQSVNLTLENVTLEAAPLTTGVPGYGLRVGNTATNGKRNPTVTVRGAETVIKGTDAGISVIASPERGTSSLVLEDGVVEGAHFGIVGNGECDGTNITVTGGTVRATDADGCALYHPQDGDLTITGGTFEGASGVQFSGAGKLDVSGGTITATAPAIASPDLSGDSASVNDGAALSLISRGGGYGAERSAEVTITGGTLTSKNNVAVREYAADGLDTLVKSMAVSQAEGKALKVEGGSGKDALVLGSLPAEEAKVVTGGTFSSMINEGYYDGTRYQQNALGAGEQPGAVVPRAYEITYDLAGGAVADGADNPTSYAFATDDFTLANPTKPGYVFAGWTGTDLEGATATVVIRKGSTGDRRYTATWTAADDTAYTVRHVFQNVAGDGYEADAAYPDQTLSGTTGTPTSAVADAVAGFTAQSVQQFEIAADGSTVVEVKYDRNTYQVHYAYAGTVPAGAPAVPADGSFRFGATVDLVSVPALDGYVWTGWSPASGFSMPAENVTVTGSWNKAPLPDADREIQVEVPADPGDGSAHATVSDRTVKTAAQNAQSALAVIEQGGVPAGMGKADAEKVASLVEQAQPGDKVTVVVSLKAEVKEGVAEVDRTAISSVVAAGEDVVLYLDLSVVMTVRVTGADGATKGEETVGLAEVDEALLFEIHVDPALIQGKSVRAAHVHGGGVEVLQPASVDRENGIVCVLASRFSTYALLTSDTCTVTFLSLGGSAVASQTVPFGGTASKPADPMRAGYTFEGWFLDEAGTRPFDFGQALESSCTVYAQWAPVSSGPASGPEGGDPGTTGGSHASGLAITGDRAGALAALPCAFVVLAFVVLAAAALRRRRFR